MPILNIIFVSPQLKFWSPFARDSYFPFGGHKFKLNPQELHLFFLIAEPQLGQLLKVLLVSFFVMTDPALPALYPGSHDF